VLHNSGNENILTVTNGVNLHFLAPDIFVNQDRVLWSYLNGGLHIFQKLFVIVHYFHGPSAQYIRRPYQNGITHSTRYFQCSPDIKGSTALGLGNVKASQQVTEFFSVLGGVNTLHRCSQYPDALFIQFTRQVYGGLAPELHYNSVGLFLIYYIKYILQRKGLKIELVGSIEVCTDSFRVVIYYYRLNILGLQPPHRMYRTVVKLNPLANPYWARPQYQGLPPPGNLHLILRIIGGIIIRGGRLKLGGTSVHHFITGCKAVFLAQSPHRSHCGSGQASHLAVGYT